MDVSVRPPWLIIGNPENRRVGLFQAALVERGWAPAQVKSWLEVIAEPARLLDLPERELLVRIDAAGENFAVEKALLARGYEHAIEQRVARFDVASIDALQPDRGRILAPRQQHLGWLCVLDELEAVFAARPGWRVLSALSSIRELFDKRRTSRRFAALGLRVPEALEGIDSHETLRAVLDARGGGEVFVKLSCGSSASCLGIYRRRGSGELLLTTMEVTPAAWYNNLRLQRVTAPEHIRELVDFLITEGAQIEHSIPKARLDGAYFDTRVLMIAGEAAFTVVRQNHHPITNLHLGGFRGRLDALHAVLPPALHDEAMQAGTRAYDAYECLHLGLDLMYEEGFAGYRMIEGNAFGDLLPNLVREGLSVYAWQIRAVERQLGGRAHL